MSEDLKVYTFDEVSKHTELDDLWVVYDGKVYDISRYLDEHPGGQEVVQDVAGTDATEAFDDIGHSQDAHDILKGLLIGRVEGGAPSKARQQTETTSEGGVSMPLIAIIISILACGAYFFLQNN